MYVVNAADALANARSLDNAVNSQDRLVDEGAQLRQHDFPQFLIYAMRSAGLDYPPIDRLPTPYSSAQARLGSSHSIPEVYWQQLRGLGVPSQALPSSFREDAAPSRPTRREADFDIYATLHRNYNSAPIPPSTPGHQHSFSQRFGSPVHPLLFNVPSTPT